MRRIVRYAATQMRDPSFGLQDRSPDQQRITPQTNGVLRSIRNTIVVTDKNFRRPPERGDPYAAALPCDVWWTIIVSQHAS